MTELSDVHDDRPTRVDGAAENQTDSDVHELLAEYVAGDGTPLPMHLFVPGTERPRTGALLFHGGGWTTGTPEQLFPQCRALAAAGVLAASAGYRFIGGAATNLADCIDDAGLAFQHFGLLASNRGVDPNNLSAGGASAGGHLAASLALFSRRKFETGSKARVRSLVLFNPVLDVNSLGADRRESYGITVEEASRLSPSKALRPGSPPTLIFHGTSDQTVPIDSIRAYRNAMRSNGDYCYVIEFPGADHGFFNYQPGCNDMYERVTTDMVRFVLNPREYGRAELNCQQ